MKSTAPSFMASTAVSMVPCAVITIVGTSDAVAVQDPEDFHAVHLRHLEIEQHDGRQVAFNGGEASRPVAAMAT